MTNSKSPTKIIALYRSTALLALFLLCFPVLSLATATNNPKTFNGSESSIVDVASIDNEAIKNLSQEELEWYKKFQNGLLFFDGWQQISNDILTCFPPEDKKKAKSLLNTIGVKIGTEWSRENSVRKIDNDHLQTWGELLKKARKQNSPLIADTLKRIAHEVDAILVE